MTQVQVVEECFVHLNPGRPPELTATRTLGPFSDDSEAELRVEWITQELECEGYVFSEDGSGLFWLDESPVCFRSVRLRIEPVPGEAGAVTDLDTRVLAHA